MTELISVLPNLSIGVVSVLCLGFITRQFLNHLKGERDEYTKALKEREDAMRGVEREVRNSIMSQLAENTSIMKEVVNIHNLRR